ncbi:MAG: hypothetical protein Q9172_005404 [Xanthocarpia lactea]
MSQSTGLTNQVSSEPTYPSFNIIHFTELTAATMDIAVSMSSNEHVTPPYDPLLPAAESAPPSSQTHRHLQQPFSDSPRRRHPPSSRTSPAPPPLHHFENADMDSAWRSPDPSTIPVGQDHDRMETDEEEPASASEDDMSSHHQDSGPSASTGHDEAMDTTPDDPHDDEEEGSADHLLGPDSQAATSSDESESPPLNVSTVNQPQALLDTSSTQNTAATGEPTPLDSAQPVPPPASDTTTAMNPDGPQDDVEANAATAPPPETGTVPPAVGDGGTPPPEEQITNQGDSEQQEGREADEDQGDDSSDEEERAYWADFVEDTSGPDEVELREIEQDEEKDALDHDHWESITFEPLDDPEYIPGASGQINWTVNPVNGTPDKPNREKIMRSPSVLIGGLYWNIKYFPRGNDGTEQMSVYVECSSSPDGPESEDESDNESSSNEENGVQSNDEAPTDEAVHRSHTASPDVDVSAVADQNTTKDTEAPSDSEVKGSVAWEAAAQIGCIVYNPKEPRVNKFRKSCHLFTKDNPDWGWTRFHGPWETIHLRERGNRQALLRNDTIAFTAYIRTVQDDTKSLWWHAPKNRSDWDSFERIGVKSLATGSSRESAIISAMSCWLHLRPVVEMIQNMRIPDATADPNERKRPLFSALQGVLDVMSKSPAETDEHTMVNFVSWLDWYVTDIQMSRTDLLVPVSVWESVRRVLNYEASGTGNMAAASDLFQNILLLKQPDPWEHEPPIASARLGQTSEDVKYSEPDEPRSVQETIVLASSSVKPFRVWSGFDSQPLESHDHPAVLQIELRRHRYDKGTRKWNKMTHHIEINETIVYTAPKTGAKHNYTLFGFVVEAGALASRDCYSVIRPSGPGTRWIKYSGNPSHRGASCLTTTQAVKAHEGSGTDTIGDSAVAHIMLYVKSENLSSILSSPQPSLQPSSSAPEATTPPPAADSGQDMPIRIYSSTLFNSHVGRGLPDLWAPVSQQDPSPILDLRLPKTASIGQEIERLDEGFFKTKGPKPYTCGLWYLMSDLCSVQGLPRILPLSKTDTLEKVTDRHDVCRVWLHMQESDVSEEHVDKGLVDQGATTEEAQTDIQEGAMEPEDAVMTQDHPTEVSANNRELGHDESVLEGPAEVALHTQPQSASGVDVPSDPPEDENEGNSNAGDADMTQDPPAEVSTSDDVIVDAQTLDGHAASPPAALQPTSGDDMPPASPNLPPAPSDDGHEVNTNSEDATMGEAQEPVISADTETSLPATPRKRFIYFFVKIFNLESQELRGIGSKLVPLESDIHTEVGRILGSEDEMELYLEKGRVMWEDDQVRPSRSFSDYELRDGCILIAHRRPSSEEATLLVTQGKHTNPMTYFQHLRYNEPSCTTHEVKFEYGTDYHSVPRSNGLVHGSGTKIYSNGDAYIGNWVSDKKSGYGTMAYSSGDTYEGNWEHDEPNGEGKMVYGSTKNVYVGGWKKGRRFGKGVMTYEVADEELALCKICYESEMDALFYDCGHVVACEECARQVDATQWG